MKASIFLAAVLLAHLAFAKNKAPEWTTGTLTNEESQTFCSDTAMVYNGSGSSGQVCSVVTSYTVDAGDIIYIFKREIHTAWDVPLIVTVNGPIKFSIGEKKVQVQDDRGKAHEVWVSKKTLKKPPPDATKQ